VRQRSGGGIVPPETFGRNVLPADAALFQINCVLGATVAIRVMRRAAPQLGVGERRRAATTRFARMLAPAHWLRLAAAPPGSLSWRELRA